MKRLFQFGIGLLVVAACKCSLAAPASPVAESSFREAMSALQSNDFAKALHCLELTVAESPENVRYSSEYRQAIIRSKEFDRSIDYFAKLLVDHPQSANLHLNYGFAYVDKIPTAGSITQVILANTALGEFSKAVEINPNWIALYTRGASYLFWPKIFNKAPLGVADLEKALELQRSGPRKPFYVRTFIALGDGYCKTGQMDKAREIWQEGLYQFPDNAQLKERLSLNGDQLITLIENGFNPNKRVDTDLREIWSDTRE
jgi:tetratricopeptide (TPR) repeat protein